MTIQAIPASEFVNSLPSVLTAAGAPLSMNAVWLDTDPSIPIGTVQSFPNLTAVENWYGATSTQAALAEIYFAGFTGAQQVPSALMFYQYNTSAVSAYLRGGSVANMTLSQLQALSGDITIVIDGVGHTSAGINLSSATSFTNAAALIQAGIQAGSPASTATVSYDTLRQAFLITSSTTGTGSTIAFPTDSSLSPSLNLTAATGAVISPGAAIATPSGAMAQIAKLSQNWGTFMTTFDPDNGGAGGATKQLFSKWNAGQADQYAYVAWDSDPAAAAGTDPSCFAQQVKALDGTIPVWSATQGASVAAFICGITASIDFNATDGRTVYAGRGTTALSPDILDATTYANIRANGYNGYCAVATRTTSFQWLQPGQISGAWQWIDPYVDQIYWNSALQTALAELISQVKFIPYTNYGYTLIREAMSDTIQAMGNFGAWVAGATLSGTQIAAVNSQAGINIAGTLQSRGWYLQISDPGATARQARQTPNINFFYVDGSSIQQITVNSIDLE